MIPTELLQNGRDLLHVDKLGTCVDRSKEADLPWRNSAELERLYELQEERDMGHCPSFYQDGVLADIY